MQYKSGIGILIKLLNFQMKNKTIVAQGYLQMTERDEEKENCFLPFMWRNKVDNKIKENVSAADSYLLYFPFVI